MLLTSTPILEDLDNDTNKSLVPYNDFLRKLATERKLPLAEVNLAFQKAIQAATGPAITLPSTASI